MYQPYNPYLANPYLQQQQLIPQQQPLAYQQAGGSIRVSGRDEAMNRLLMMYPSTSLVPGFISDAVFDIDGRHFHALSIEQDGSRNLETFSYQLDMPNASQDYVSRSEFQELVNRLNAMTGGTNGVPEPVQATAATASQPTA